MWIKEPGGPAACFAPAGLRSDKKPRHVRSIVNQTRLNDLSRRSFFGQVAGGIYGTALASLLSRDVYGDAPSHAFQPNDLLPRAPHFEPKARAVIHLYMNGGPSQMDLFDPKPMLHKLHGTQHF